MMDQAIQLFGFLILAFLGMVAPILLVLLSVFREGVLKLSEESENERAKNEKNIKQQMAQLEEGKEIDEKAIKASLKELRTMKKTAKTKLSYLNPKMQILRLFLPLMISFFSVILATLVKDNTYYMSLLIVVSLISFAYVLVALCTLLGVLAQVRKFIDDDRQNINSKIIELLSALVVKGGKDFQYYLKNVHITVNDAVIKDDKNRIKVEVNKKQELKVGISNLETKMAKNVQIGFIFPLDFIIEKGRYFLTNTSETEQVVRHKESLIQGKTHIVPIPLIITSLKEGDYKIKTRISAENIEARFHYLTLKVTRSSSANESLK